VSTYVYLVCMDHEPPLMAEDESGQHLYDLPRIRREIADREATVAAGAGYHESVTSAGFDPAEYFRAHSARFLAQHLTCQIGIRDEYGVEHALTEADQ